MAFQHVFAVNLILGAGPMIWHILEDANHFLPEDKATEIAGKIKGFMKK